MLPYAGRPRDLGGLAPSGSHSHPVACSGAGPRDDLGISLGLGRDARVREADGVTVGDVGVVSADLLGGYAEVGVGLSEGSPAAVAQADRDGRVIVDGLTNPLEEADVLLSTFDPVSSTV